MFCLQSATAPSWAAAAIDALDEVLIDHAHCELKAASSALSLAPRFFEHPDIVQALVTLAQEELEHFNRLLAELRQRGLTLGIPAVDTYASQLRKRAVKSCPGDRRSLLVDRLLIGALIEARSCERFQLLSHEAQRRGLTEEQALYDEFMASEARHYTTLRQLAIDMAGDEPATLARLSALAALEAEINDEGGRAPAIHG